MKPIIAIVGRPNVGKSTLFNRILGRRTAIVQDLPGVTRDRNYASTQHNGRAFVIVDTGGFDPDAAEGMLALMRRQVELALAEADAVIHVLDVRDGLTATDEAIWALLRRSGKPAYCVVNKVDRPDQVAAGAEFFRLGTEPETISAANGSGVAEVLDRIVADLDAPEAGDDDADGEGPIRIAVIGRPNVGKSTFANSLLGRERYLTSDVPGTTRDAIDTPFRHEGRDYLLVDTAGMRRRANVENGLESMSVSRAVAALQRCHVAALVIDGAEGVTDQDKKLAALAIDRGRGLVILVNKWDLVPRDAKAGDAYRDLLARELGFAAFAPHLFVSAIAGRNVSRFLPLVDRVHASLFFRIPTNELNRFYEEVVRTHPPSASGTGAVRIKYLTQVDVNPPVILMFKSGKARVPRHYLKFVERSLRERYGFVGAPILLCPK